MVAPYTYYDIVCSFPNCNKQLKHGRYCTEHRLLLSRVSRLKVNIGKSEDEIIQYALKNGKRNHRRGAPLPKHLKYLEGIKDSSNQGATA